MKPIPQQEERALSRSLQQEMVDADDETNGTGEKQEPRRPLQYFDNLRNSSFPYETRQGSAMYSVRDTDRNETIRLVHVASLNPYSEMPPGDNRTLVDLVMYIDAAAFLALHHFNERSSLVLPHLPDLLQNCNAYMTIDILDTLFSPIVASREVVELLTRRQDLLTEPYPLSIAGAARSAVTQPMATLAGVFQVPIVNGVSTSSALDQKDEYPTFVRTCPNNKLDSQAVVTYLRSLGVTHFGVLFVKDPYGSEFSKDLAFTAAKYNMTIVSAACDDGDANDIANAVRELQQTKFHYFFAAITPSAFFCKLIIQNAVDLGIAGNPNYVWLWPEINLIEAGFYETTLDSSLESDRRIAEAITGMGMILIDVPSNERFDSALSEMGKDEELFDYFVSKHDAEAELFDGFDWKPRSFFYQYFSYDYITALGIALCGMEEEFPTGPQIVEALKSTEFSGVSGPVSFDPVTGTRTAESITFKTVNVVVDVQEDSIKPEYYDSALINGGTGEVQVLTPYVYAQGSMEAPPSLPPPTVDPNLIGLGARVTGWCLAGLVVFISVGFGVWTYCNRTKNVIRVAQPFFLGLLCVGIAIMALAIIPMSFEEPMSNKTLDRACMTVPWLLTMGFATAFSSLFCKTLRLNKLFRQSAGMQRVQVKVKDAIWPFITLTVVNFVLLLAWTLVAPLEWTRVEVNNVDSFGRSVESYGTCFAYDSDEHTSGQNRARIGFLIALGVFNFGAVILANIESYKARKLPSDFNESFYLALSMVSILEGFLIGVPILFLGSKSPTVFFVVGSLLITFLCLGILLPTFVQKIVLRRQKSGLNRSQWHGAWTTYNSAGRRARSSYQSQQSSDAPQTPSGAGSSCRGTVAEIRTGAAARSSYNSEQSSGAFRRPSGAGSSCHGTVAEIRARAELADRQARQGGNDALQDTRPSGGGRVTVADIRARAAKADAQAGRLSNEDIP